jgi:hypothetical protein
MQAANMEVHMSQTEGEKEKCVDIALAVEMLHYATVPGAYDLAVRRHAYFEVSARCSINK